MRKIPPEILSSIFTLVVKHNCFGQLNPYYPQQVGASFLTKICSQWSAVALNTPEIWARIYIGHQLTFPLDGQMMEVEKERLRLCMGRAKSLPLSVEVVLEGSPSIEDLGGYVTLLQELVENSNWASLIVRMRDIPQDVCEAVLEMVQDRNLESLQRLEVRLGNMQGIESLLRRWQGVTTFPNLRTLRIQHAFLYDVWQYFRSIDISIFPYSQLTHVYLDLYWDEESLEILRLCCRSVRSVQIDSRRRHFDIDTILPPIYFPFLDSLVINSLSVKHFQTFITTFTTPSLKSLSLSCMGLLGDLYMPPSSQVLTHFLKRSRISTTLQKLHLSIHDDVHPSDPWPFMDVLEVTTGLEELLFSVSEHNEAYHDYREVRPVDFLRRLARDDDRFLPKLKHLHIHHLESSYRHRASEQPDREWVNAFEAMIELRSAHELRSVILEIESLSGNKSDMGLDLEKLRRLEAASDQRGLGIRVVKTSNGKIRHEVLGYGLGAQLCVDHHHLWMRTTDGGTCIVDNLSGTLRNSEEVEFHRNLA